MSKPLWWKVFICIPLASGSLPTWTFNLSIIARLLPTLNYKSFYIIMYDVCIFFLFKLITAKHICLLLFFRHSVEQLGKIFSNFTYSKVWHFFNGLKLNVVPYHCISTMSSPSLILPMPSQCHYFPHCSSSHVVLNPCTELHFWKAPHNCQCSTRPVCTAWGWPLFRPFTVAWHYDISSNKAKET